jgi:arylsulfatase A-like enzyme
LFVVTAQSLPAKEPGADLTRPNIVFLLVDDLGWSDLGCYGSDLHETPNIDRLAAQGMRFTDAYAPAPVCSPTRAAIMTGEHPARLHMTIWREGANNPPSKFKVIPPVTREDLPLEKITIAERLKEAGYATAHLGKWHLGDGFHYPETQGFDVNIGATHWGCPPTFYYPYRGEMFGDYRYVPGLPIGKQGDYLTDQLTGEALKVIDSLKDRPFYLYMAYYTVHFPIEGKQELVDRYRKKLKPGLRHTNASYAAMVHSLDESVGRILDRLKKHGIDDNTIVFLTSDNGGFIGNWKEQPVVTNNAPLRSGKGSLYEGGIREPLLVRWPGVTKAGTVCSEPVVLTDTYRTIVQMAGLDVPEKQLSNDGVSLTPLLRDSGAKLQRDTLYWHYPHYYSTTTPVTAIRDGDWKLLEYLEDGRLELYNLRDDLGETVNLAERLPERRNELAGKLRVWRKSVDAQMPARNPEFKR